MNSLNNQVSYPPTLNGKNVDLISFEIKHLSDLEKASREKKIWEFYTVDCYDPVKFNEAYKEALIEKEKGTQFPFVIFHKKDNKVIGSTRFLEIQPRHRKLEIGWTWLHPDYWATTVNLECKLLLLTYCFESLKTVRVQFRTDENNLRSRRAIEKTGGKFEGIFRNDMIRDNGSKRNSAYYSITDDDWIKLKEILIQKVNDL